MPRTKRHVPGVGPYTAPLLWIGEAPGQTEERRGIPFVGVSGKRVRHHLSNHGIDAEDIRINNVIPINVGKITAQNRDTLCASWWDNITDDLARMSPRVIVACGGVALRRLTSLTDITNESGGVIHSSTIGESITIKQRRLPTHLPDDTLVIPIVHPAGIMRTKVGGGWDHFDRIVARIARYATGALELRPPKPHVVTRFKADVLDRVLTEASIVFIDTEYNIDDHIPYLIGLTTDKLDEHTVYSFAPHERYVDVLAKHFARSDLLKVAHNYMADVQALHTLGVRWHHPSYCTMLAASALYPDLRIGLNHVALLYLDHIRNWKDMAHDDPEYNALDVMYMRMLFPTQRQEIAAAGMQRLLTEEIFPVAPLCTALEVRGLRVDADIQAEMIAERQAEYEATEARVQDAVKEMCASKSAAIEIEIQHFQHEHDYYEAGARRAVTIPCPLHPDYIGVRKKRFATTTACECATIYEAVAPQREGMREKKAQVTKQKTKLKKWTTKGFNLLSSHDLRWLLYNEEGYGLPPQRKDGRITTDADAVAKLKLMLYDNRAKIKSKYHRTNWEEITKVLKDIKHCQHLRKFISTFLQPPVDAHGIAHPPYRPWGAGSGRPASGKDAVVASDRGASEYTFNALNIPDKCRRIFIPHKR